MIAWLLLAAYLVALAVLAVAGMRKTTTLAGFAIGNRDMGPVLVGVVMASSIASTATFVINPGFVYTHGLSALLHYGVAAQAGVALGLVAVAKGFRRVGDEHRAVTVPDWIRARYGSEPLALAFALANLLSIAFVVLILFGCALLLGALTGWGHTVSLVAVLVVVFGYVAAGGAYAHAYTNAAQAAIMLVVACVLFFSGVEHLGPGFLDRLAAAGPGYGAAVNPHSDLYASTFSVFVSGFVVTFALMLQPHILTKVLYLRTAKDVRRFVVTAIVTGAVFSLCLFVGVYAQLDGIDLALVDQDKVVTTYVVESFGPSAAAFVLVALLAAGMSTLDGILVAVSAMVTHDLVLRGRPEKGSRRGVWISRGVVAGVGALAFLLAVDPPPLVGLFAQKGVYGLAAASFVPIVFGVLVRRRLAVAHVAIASAVALAVHFGLTFAGVASNPAVCACYAIGASVMIALALMLTDRGLRCRREPTR